MKKTSVCCSFSIFSEEDFNINYVTECLNIKPSKFYNNKKKYTIVEEKIISIFETAWILKVNYQESFDINVQLNIIFEILKDKINLLIKLKKELKVKFCFNLGVDVYDHINPAIYLESETIKFLNLLEASIDIDVINYIQ